MSRYFASAVLAAGEGGDPIWIQLLVVVIIAAAAGLWSTIITKTKRSKAATGHTGMYKWQDSRMRRLKEAVKGEAGKWVGALVESVRDKTGGKQVAALQPAGLPRQEAATTAPRRNLAGGMELLDTDFLVGVVEDLAGQDQRDIAMRKFAFAELVRRAETTAVDSEPLTTYARDEHGLYGKLIQYEAMEELSRRTQGPATGKGAAVGEWDYPQHSISER